MLRRDPQPPARHYNALMSSVLEKAATLPAALQPLEPERVAVVVIDIQEKLLPPIWQGERMVRNSQLLLRLAGVLHLRAKILRIRRE